MFAPASPCEAVSNGGLLMDWLVPAQRFSTTFFNKTADLVEKPSWVDFELLGLYLGFAAALAGLGAPHRCPDAPRLLTSSRATVIFGWLTLTCGFLVTWSQWHLGRRKASANSFATQKAPHASAALGSAYAPL